MSIKTFNNPKNSETTNSRDTKITAPEGARYLGD